MSIHIECSSAYDYHKVILSVIKEDGGTEVDREILIEFVRTAMLVTAALFRNVLGRSFDFILHEKCG